MRLFLDTEFNGFGGELISMALVAEDNREWYGVLALPWEIHPWVAEHVVPFLDIDNKCVIFDHDAFQLSLGKFLAQFPNAEIIADWPADIEHLCRIMCHQGAMAGWRIPGEYTFELTHVSGIEPEIPHNALSDARALKEAYLRNEQRNAYIATQMVELGESVREYNSVTYPLAI